MFLLMFLRVLTNPSARCDQSFSEVRPILQRGVANCARSQSPCLGILAFSVGLVYSFPSSGSFLFRGELLFLFRFLLAVAEVNVVVILGHVGNLVFLAQVDDTWKSWNMMPISFLREGTSFLLILYRSLSSTSALVSFSFSL